MYKKPRDCQERLIESVRSAFKRGIKGCVVEAYTGFGKAYCISRISEMSRERNGRVLVLVNRDNLCEQLFESIRQQGLFPVMERGQDKASTMSEMVIGSVQTLQNERLKRWPKDHFKLVITDECHFAAAKTFHATLDYFSTAWHVGFSATIERHDKKGLWKGYQECVFAMPLTEGINEGWLVPFEFIELPVPIQIDDKLATKKMFTEEDESNVFKKENYLPRLYAASAEARGNLKSLFFWPNCDASKDATTYFKSIGLQAKHIDGYISRNEQNEILEWFKNTPNSILSNADLLSYGYDNPSIQCIGIMRLSRSLPMLKQRLGRGTRPACPVDSFEGSSARREAIAASDKPTVRVLDLMLQLGNVTNSFATPTDLITDDKDEREFLRKERQSGVPINLEELGDKLKMKRQTDKDAQLAKLAEQAANAAENRRRSSMHRGVYIGHILDKKSGSKPASKPHLRFLAGAYGYRPSGEITAQQACRITELFKEKLGAPRQRQSA